MSDTNQPEERVNTLDRLRNVSSNELKFIGIKVSVYTTMLYLFVQAWYVGFPIGLEYVMQNIDQQALSGADPAEIGLMIFAPVAIIIIQFWSIFELLDRFFSEKIAAKLGLSENKLWLTPDIDLTPRSER